MLNFDIQKIAICNYKKYIYSKNYIKFDLCANYIHAKIVITIQISINLLNSQANHKIK